MKLEEQAPRPVASVVIPAHNAASELPLQLAALSAQTTYLPFEVLVADNGSTDGTAATAKAFENVLRVRVIDASERKGVNHARNRGAAEARGDVILLCDSDDRVAPNWIDEMTAALERFDGVGGSYALWSPEQGITGEVQSPEHLTQHVFLPYPLGANCGFRREIWRILGGFNESYNRRGADEVEFFWRLQLKGFRFGVASNAKIEYRMAHEFSDQLKKAYRVRREGMRLANEFARYGFVKPSFIQILRRFIGLLRRFPTLFRSRQAFKEWLLLTAANAGRLAGLWRYR